MNIISFNVNGIRAADRKGLSQWLLTKQPDVLCVQELKAHDDQIPKSLTTLGYHLYSSTATRKGYSGVATFTKQEPNHTITKTGIDWIDDEGRIVVTTFDTFQLINLYTPSGSSGQHRQDFKELFMEQFPEAFEQFRRNDLPQVIATDMNIAHTEIDIHNPKSNKKSPGFLPEERNWMTNFLSTGYTDSFRHLHAGEPDHYSWWSYRARARERNKGWRIDYLIIENELTNRLENARILTDVVMSDHAPIEIQLDL